MIAEIKGIYYLAGLGVFAFWFGILFICWLYCWLKDRRPKQRRCQDCKHCEFESVTKRKVMCHKLGWIDTAVCKQYTRKWWAIGRAK